jgi:hypothetical protein
MRNPITTIGFTSIIYIPKQVTEYWLFFVSTDKAVIKKHAYMYTYLPTNASNKNVLCIVCAVK